MPRKSAVHKNDPKQQKLTGMFSRSPAPAKKINDKNNFGSDETAATVTTSATQKSEAPANEANRQANPALEDVAIFPVDFETFRQYTNIYDCAVMYIKTRKPDTFKKYLTEKHITKFMRRGYLDFYTTPKSRKEIYLSELKITEDCSAELRAKIYEIPEKYKKLNDDNVRSDLDDHISNPPSSIRSKYSTPKYKYPVTQEYFKKYTHYEKVIDKILENYANAKQLRVQDLQLSIAEREALFNNYFHDFYYKPSVRDTIPLRMKACHYSVKEKIFQIPAAIPHESDNAASDDVEAIHNNSTSSSTPNSRRKRASLDTRELSDSAERQPKRNNILCQPQDSSERNCEETCEDVSEKKQTDQITVESDAVNQTADVNLSSGKNYSLNRVNPTENDTAKFRVDFETFRHYTNIYDCAVMYIKARKPNTFQKYLTEKYITKLMRRGYHDFYTTPKSRTVFYLSELKINEDCPTKLRAKILEIPEVYEEQKKIADNVITDADKDLSYSKPNASSRCEVRTNLPLPTTPPSTPLSSKKKAPDTNSTASSYKYPVTQEYFKKYTRYEEVVDKLLENYAKTINLRVQDLQLDMAERETCFNNYYHEFYYKPSVRETFPLRLKPCPYTVKAKILEIPTATTDETINTASDDVEVCHNNSSVTIEDLRRKRSARDLSDSAEQEPKRKKVSCQPLETSESNCKATCKDVTGSPQTDRMTVGPEAVNQNADVKSSGKENYESKKVKPTEKDNAKFRVDFETFRQYTNIYDCVVTYIKARKPNTFQKYLTEKQIMKFMRSGYYEFYTTPKKRRSLYLSKLKVNKDCPSELRAKICETSELHQKRNKSLVNTDENVIMAKADDDPSNSKSCLKNPISSVKANIFKITPINGENSEDVATDDTELCEHDSSVSSYRRSSIEMIDLNDEAEPQPQDKLKINTEETYKDVSKQIDPETVESNAVNQIEEVCLSVEKENNASEDTETLESNAVNQNAEVSLSDEKENHTSKCVTSITTTPTSSKYKYPVTKDYFKKYTFYDEVIDKILERCAKKSNLKVQDLQQDVELRATVFRNYYHAFYYKPSTRQTYPLRLKECHSYVKEKIFRIPTANEEKSDDVASDDVEVCHNDSLPVMRVLADDAKMHPIRNKVVQPSQESNCAEICKEVSLKLAAAMESDSVNQSAFALSSVQSMSGDKANLPVDFETFRKYTNIYDCAVVNINSLRPQKNLTEKLITRFMQGGYLNFFTKPSKRKTMFFSQLKVNDDCPAEVRLKICETPEKTGNEHEKSTQHHISNTNNELPPVEKMVTSPALISQYNYPVTQELFKKCTHYEEVVDKILENCAQAKNLLVQDLQQDSVLRQTVFCNYFHTFYYKPSVRTTFPLRMKPVPSSIKAKIFEASIKCAAVEERVEKSVGGICPLNQNNSQKVVLQEATQIESKVRLHFGYQIHQNKNDFESRYVKNKVLNPDKLHRNTSILAPIFASSKITAETLPIQKKKLHIQSIEVFPRLQNIEKSQSSDGSTPFHEEQAQLIFKQYDKCFTLPYVIRRCAPYKPKQRILRALLEMSFDEFCQYTRIHNVEAHNEREHLSILRRYYQFAIIEPQVWPIELYIGLGQLQTYLQAKNVPLEQLELRFISPKLLHWSELTAVTNFDECVHLDYYKSTGEEIASEELLQERRVSYYERCWTHEQWIWQAPVVIDAALSLQLGILQDQTEEAQLEPNAAASNSFLFDDDEDTVPFDVYSRNSDYRKTVHRKLDKTAVQQYKETHFESDDQDTIPFVSKKLVATVPNETQQTEVSSSSQTEIKTEMPDEFDQTLPKITSTQQPEANQISSEVETAAADVVDVLHVNKSPIAPIKTYTPRRRLQPIPRRVSPNLFTSESGSSQPPTLSVSLPTPPLNAIAAVSQSNENIVLLPNTQAQIEALPDEEQCPSPDPLSADLDVGSDENAEIAVQYSNQRSDLIEVLSADIRDINSYPQIKQEFKVLRNLQFNLDDETDEMHCNPLETTCILIDDNDERNLSFELMPFTGSDSQHSRTSALSLNALGNTTMQINESAFATISEAQRLPSTLEEVEPVAEAVIPQTESILSTAPKSIVNRFKAPTHISEPPTCGINLVPHLETKVTEDTTMSSSSTNNSLPLSGNSTASSFSVTQALTSDATLFNSTNLQRAFDQQQQQRPPSRISTDAITGNAANSAAASISNRLNFFVEIHPSGIQHQKQVIGAGTSFSTNGLNANPIVAPRPSSSDREWTVQLVNIQSADISSTVEPPIKQEFKMLNQLQFKLDDVTDEIHCEPLPTTPIEIDVDGANNLSFDLMAADGNSDSLLSQAPPLSLSSMDNLTPLSDNAFEAQRLPSTLEEPEELEAPQVAEPVAITQLLPAEAIPLAQSKKKTATTTTRTKATKTAKSKRSAIPKKTAGDLVPQLTHEFRALPLTALSTARPKSKIVAANATSSSSSSSANTSTSSCASDIAVPLSGSTTIAKSFSVSHVLAANSTLFHSSQLERAVDQQQQPTSQDGDEGASNAVAVASITSTASTVTNQVNDVASSTVNIPLQRQQKQQKVVLYRGLLQFDYFQELNQEHIKRYQLNVVRQGIPHMDALIRCGQRRCEKTKLYGDFLGALLPHCSRTLLQDFLVVLHDLNEFHYNAATWAARKSHAAREDVRERVLYYFLQTAPVFGYWRVRSDSALYEEGSLELVSPNANETLTRRPHRPLVHALKPAILSRMAQMKENL